MSLVVLGDTCLNESFPTLCVDYHKIFCLLTEIPFFLTKYESQKKVGEPSPDFVVIAYDYLTHQEARKLVEFLEEEHSFHIYVTSPLAPLKLVELSDVSLVDKIHEFRSVQRMFETELPLHIHYIDWSSFTTHSIGVSTLPLQDPDVLTSLFELLFVKQLNCTYTWYRNAVNFHTKSKDGRDLFIL